MVMCCVQIGIYVLASGTICCTTTQMVSLMVLEMTVLELDLHKNKWLLNLSISLLKEHL